MAVGWVVRAWEGGLAPPLCAEGRAGGAAAREVGGLLGGLAIE